MQKNIVEDKRGLEFGSLVTYGTLFVIIAITLGIGAKVLDKVNDNLTGDALDAVNNGSAGIKELASWLPTIGIVIAAAVVIGVVFLMVRGKD